MGPFLDAEHSLIKNPTGELAKMTYKEVCPPLRRPGSNRMRSRSSNHIRKPAGVY
jgi:hypothetical protein